MATAPTSTTYSIPDLEVFGGHAVSDITSFVSHRVQLNPATNNNLLSDDSDTRQIIQVQEYSTVNGSENTVEDEDKSVPKKPVWY